MKSTAVAPRLLTVPGIVCLWLITGPARTQTVAVTSQIVPFATGGAVTTTDPKGKTLAVDPVPGVAPAPSSTATIAVMAQAGGKIATGADGATSIIVGGAGTARMGADSEVRVPSSGEKGHSLELLKGRLFLNISADELKQRGAGEFRLKTPSVLLAVKGTKFFATITDDSLIVGVHEGTTEVISDAKTVLTLNAGQAVTINGGQILSSRDFTDEEKNAVAEYPPALVPWGVGVVPPGKRPAKDTGAMLTWSACNAYDAEHFKNLGASAPPDQPQDGTIRFRFSRPPSDAFLFHCTANLSLKGKAKAFDQSPPIALLLKITASNIPSVTFAWGGSNERMRFMRQDVRNSSTSALEHGVTAYVLVPVPPVNPWRSTADLRLNADFDLPTSSARAAIKEFKVEMSEFRFLTIPQ